MYLSKAMKVCVFIAILLNLQAALAIAKKGSGNPKKAGASKNSQKQPQKLSNRATRIKLLKEQLQSCESQLQSLNTECTRIQNQLNKKTTNNLVKNALGV